jgi:inosose dehydratase
MTSPRRATVAHPPVALNPIMWFLGPDGFDPAAAPALPEIYRQIKEAGFDAVHIEIPGGLSVTDYRALLDDSGLLPAPGYFQASFSNADAQREVIEQAKRVAAEHAALGLDRIFIAEQFPALPRLMAPARGVDADPDRLARIADGLTTVASVMVREGVTPCLHQHVGTWIETPAETEFVLAAVDPGLLLFGPDTGHLAWAGADPAAFIAEHLDRVGAVHLKDVRSAIVSETNLADSDFGEAVRRHVWTEPGRGDLDLTAVLEVLGGYRGWYVIEVDLADQESPRESARVSAAWVRNHLERSSEVSP